MKIMDDWLSKEEIQRKYRHVSEHQMPFETKIVDIIPPKGINFSDRWKFLKGLFYIIEDEISGELVVDYVFDEIEWIYGTDLMKFSLEGKVALWHISQLRDLT